VFGDVAIVTSTSILILRVVFAPTPIPREPPKRTGILRLRLPLRKHRAMRLRLHARPRTAPAPAEKRKARVGAVVREDARAELRVVRRAGDVRCCAAHELHLLFVVWLKAKEREKKKDYEF
jgi:hypothetical protein